MLGVVFDGRGGSNSPPLPIAVQPRSASVVRNGYHEADTWTIEFDQRLLPFDPDSVASCEVRIYMWDAKGDDSPTRPWAIDDYEMIRGLADDTESSIVGEDNCVKMTGRDYTGVLLDLTFDPKHKVPAGKPIDETIQALADLAAPPGTRARFEVIWRAQGEPPIFENVIGRSVKTKGGGTWIKPDKTYWDVIYDIAISHGFIAYVTTISAPGEALRPVIIVTDPATQTSESLKSAPRLAYGRHLSKLGVKRKLAREKVPQIVLVAWDPKTKKQIEVVYPEKRNVTTDALGIQRPGDTGSVAVKKDDQEFVPAPFGITDRDTLLKYAKLRFFHRGRAETEYTFGTSFLTVEPTVPDGLIGPHVESGQFANDVDLLRLQPGSAVGIKFDPFLRDNLRTLLPGQRVEHLIALGYGNTVATFIALNIELLDAFEQPYYFNAGKFDYSVDDGIDIEITAVNFASAVREIAFSGAVSEHA